MIDQLNGAAGFKPRAALFDMDGLMLDTERPAVSLWIEAAREQGWEIGEDVPVSTVGLDELKTRERVMEACGPSFPYEKVRLRLEELYAAHFAREGIRHRPGLIVLLDKFAASGVPLAVATSTPRGKASALLRSAGIADRFAALACGDEVGRGKPAPDIFLLAAARLGAEARDCVGFEDSAAGLRSLAAAGIRSVFVRDLVEPPAEVLATVWRRCADLAEAASLFST